VAESSAKCLQIAKEMLTPWGACGVQTLYMTGSMQTDRKTLKTAILQALD
jgi:hypothetical protein